ncbi:SDR family NAD(P)-dependent oxidoreductase [Virgibacillus byunsanensis]|uniref:SDR family NAD(P)-dependent oxidoreductase n=1 Tax=Virgibacillus byunsanensis TaxID=570945 RepID=A0ABW3LNW8_9BACI
MKDEIVVITGANSGIGKAAAIKFAAEGYTVIMACRNLELSRETQKEIIAVSNNDQVKLMELDTASFASIRTFCSAFKSQYDKLDILIHNAAYMNHGEKYRLSPDNIELTFATNVFGPYLITTLLLDDLKKSKNPRILHACSNIIKHFFDPKRKIDFDQLQGQKKDSKRHSVYKNYCASKMALLMVTFKMADVYQNDGVKVNALQINGAKMSKATLRKVKPHWRIIARIQNLYFPSPSVMAQHYFDICTSDKFETITGKLIDHKQKMMQQPPSHNPNVITQIKQITGSKVYPAYAANPEIQEKLWELCNSLTNKNMVTPSSEQHA